MSQWLRVGALLAGILAAAVVGAWVAGARLPEEHTATVTAWYEASPEAVWRTVTDLEHLPEWRSDVAAVELVSHDDGRAGWVEIDGWGERTAFEVVEARFPDHFVARVADDDAPFGGTWTWHIESQGTGAAVTITEDGFVRSAPMRAIAKYLIGHESTMRTVLADLGTHLGHDPVFDP